MGNKVSKDRFSLLVCANATSKKEKLLVIGKVKRPHSFPKYNSNLSHHVTNRSNKHGWMTTAIFTVFEFTKQQDGTSGPAYFDVS